MKPKKYAVALVIHNDEGNFLITKRPEEDESLQEFWGFPARSKKNKNEDWVDVAHQVAKIKLGVDIEIKRLIGEGKIEREKYILVLRDYEAKIINGEPSVPQNYPGVTQYTDMRWVNDPNLLKKSAKGGGLCSRVFLESKNINWD